MPLNNKRIYFVSDAHLGAPNTQESLKRERLLIKWLEEVRKDALEIYIVGDLFDFWFEYKHVVPKGYVRLLAKLAEIVESGIPIKLFIGNHDMWLFDYLPNEIGVEIIRKPIDVNYGKHTFHIAHGDGLGPGDRGYKMIKGLFSSKICQWLFARIHPNFGIGIANYWSRKSRSHTKKKDEFHGNEKEWLVIYAQEKLQEKAYDFFVFGHRHLPLEIELNKLSNAKVSEAFNNQKSSKYVNLGDWIEYFTYAVYDGEELSLKTFKTSSS